MTAIERLQRWYARQCDGEWEHRHGVSIQSCDNPGWWVKVELTGTHLSDVPFERVARNVNDDGWPQTERWLCCRVSDGVWQGAGDETRLAEILGVFLSWAETHEALAD